MVFEHPVLGHSRLETRERGIGRISALENVAEQIGFAAGRAVALARLLGGFALATSLRFALVFGLLSV